MCCSSRCSGIFLGVTNAIIYTVAGLFWFSIVHRWPIAVLFAFAIVNSAFLVLAAATVNNALLVGFMIAESTRMVVEFCFLIVLAIATVKFDAPFLDWSFGIEGFAKKMEYANESHPELSLNYYIMIVLIVLAGLTIADILSTLSKLALAARIKSLSKE